MPTSPRFRPLFLLLPAILGIVTSLITALTLVPRVRLVEVITVFGTAVGGGAALTWAIVEFRKARPAGAVKAPVKAPAVKPPTVKARS